MKTNKFKTTLMRFKCILLIIIILIIGVSCQRELREARTKTFKETVGVYKIDLKRTNLGIYAADSMSYKDLEFNLKQDSTFTFSIQVPFIFEQNGRWIAGGVGPEEWNWLSFSSWLKKRPLDFNAGNQFTRPYNDDGDIVIYLNGVAAMNNNKGIQEIWFRKIQ